MRNVPQHAERAGDAERSDAGSALVVALLLAVALFLLGAAFLTVSYTDRQIATNEMVATRAFDAAEAGIDHAVAQLNDTTVNTLLAAGGTLFTNQALGSGTYSVVVANNTAAMGTFAADAGGANDTDGRLIVTSTGRFQGGERVIRVLVDRNAGSQTFNSAALYANTTITVGGGGQIYGNVLGNGVVTLNTTVHGNVSSGSTVTNPSNATGTVLQNQPSVSFPDVTCPAGAFGPAPTGLGVTFNAATGDLTLAGNADTTFATGTYYFRNFDKCCNGFMQIAGVGNLVIYVSGSLAVSGNGFNNAGGPASRAQVFACGTNNSAWSFAGNNHSYFVMYAPRHAVSFSGNGHKYGTYVGLSITKSGNANIYADSGITLPGGQYRIIPRTWRELW